MPHETSDDHHKSRLLGILRIANDAQTSTTVFSRLLGILRIADHVQTSTTVFSGHITCPHCSTSIDIEVDRNPKAVSVKQPAFVINETGTTSRDKSLGHLFIGTILSSPVLYYGGSERVRGTHLGAK